MKLKVNWTDLVQGFSLHHNSIVNKKSKPGILGNYESGINIICTRSISNGETIDHFSIKLEDPLNMILSFQINDRKWNF